MPHGLGIHRVKVNRWRVQIARQHKVVQVQQLAQLGGKALWVLEVLHTQRTTRDLVFIGRADAATGGTDLLDTALLPMGFAGNIECNVKWQDKRTGFTDAQARADLNTRLFKSFDFLE